jgi:hypothetical protein
MNRISTPLVSVVFLFNSALDLNTLNHPQALSFLRYNRAYSFAAHHPFRVESRVVLKIFFASSAFEGIYYFEYGLLAMIA